MVFYGKKRSEIEQQNQQCRSIKQEILKELEQRITPVYEKSLATIFSDVGDVILVATQTVLNIALSFKRTQIYVAYQQDKRNFHEQIKSEKIWYQIFPKKITQNKFYLIKNYSCQSRMFFLNTAVFLLGVMSLRFNKNFASRFRGLMSTCIFGYGFGGIFIVPQIYNTLITQNIVA